MKKLNESKQQKRDKLGRSLTDSQSLINFPTVKEEELKMVSRQTEKPPNGKVNRVQRNFMKISESEECLGKPEDIVSSPVKFNTGIASPNGSVPRPMKPLTTQLETQNSRKDE